MDLFDTQEYARARHRDALRSFRFAERAGLTREEKQPRKRGRFGAITGGRAFAAQDWRANAEG